MNWYRGWMMGCLLLGSSGLVLPSRVCAADPAQAVGAKAAGEKAAEEGSPGATKPRLSSDGKLLLHDGDRIVFIGNTFVERAQASDYIETRLTALAPEKQLTFRNLGWSGDTVWGDARAGFKNAAYGFDQLKQQVHGLQPTVIVIAYGAVESWEGAAGLPKFLSGLETLLKMLEPTKAQVVFVSPLRQEKLDSPYPDPAAHNADLQLYTEALAKVAQERQAPYLNLFQLMTRHETVPPSAAPRRWTDNGIHLTDYGYWQVAEAFTTLLVPPPGTDKGGDSWSVTLDLKSKSSQARGTTVSPLEAVSTGVRFETRDARLPVCLPPGAPMAQQAAWKESGLQRTLKVTGLPAGNYVLKIDGERVLRGTAEQWGQGLVISAGPELEQVEKLRQTILNKNMQYFHRWRPQNETYLFGFRKHEQGVNAREVPLFEPIVVEQESLIAKLRIPVAHRYELELAP